MYHNDNDELTYLWTKVKFVQKYMSENKNSTLEDAEESSITGSKALWRAESNKQTKY